MNDPLQGIALARPGPRDWLSRRGRLAQMCKSWQFAVLYLDLSVTHGRLSWFARNMTSRLWAMTGDTSKIDMLVVDDDPDFASFVGAVAADIGLRAELITDPKTFAARCEQVKPSIVVMDISMPDIDGMQLAQWLGQFMRTTGHAIRLIFISGQGEDALQLSQSVGRITGLRDTFALGKPIEYAVLAQALKGATWRPKA